MPLIDSGESTKDVHLTNLFNTNFSSFSNGQILDNSGCSWMIWSLLELERWWSLFESNVGVPFGRKLFNSCADEEEFQLRDNQIIKTGWFKNSKNRRNLKSRWELLGWGEIDIDSKEIRTGLPSGIGPGLALAAMESYYDLRFKSEWKQKNQTEIDLQLTQDVKVLSPAKKHSSLPWSSSQNNIFESEQKIELESRNLGWSIDGEPMTVLPTSLFSRLFFSTLGFETSISREVLDSWTISGMDERFTNPLIIASYTTFQLFIESDKHVFIESIDSWAPLIDYYSSTWGWGGALDIQKTDKLGGVSIKFPANESLPFFIGLMMGIWYRSYGKKPKMSVFFENNICTLLIESLLDYA